MTDGTNGAAEAKAEPQSTKPPLCTCIQDPFAALPPEARPPTPPKKGDLRKVECPGCGMEYWTNRATDLCIDCERKGARPSASQPRGDDRSRSREEGAG